MVSIIVAVGNYIVDKGFPIGKDGKIPWHNSEDLKNFRKMTTDNVVIMGRRTFESIGNKPLPDRVNIVISRTEHSNENGVIYDTSLINAVAEAQVNYPNKEIFIMGGASIYEKALKDNIVDRMYVTYLAEDVPDADTFFPKIGIEWEDDGNPFELLKSKAYMVTYDKTEGKDNHVDEQYLNLVNEIIEKGSVKETRAGRTRSLFARQMRFNMQDGLPILTTKKVFTKGCIHELLWFLKGDSNIKYLVDNNVHIWDDDAYRDYCQKVDEYNRLQVKRDPIEKISKEEFIEKVKNNEYDGKLFYNFGDLGPVYGVQWRHSGEAIIGKDQIRNVIETLKKNPNDRRLLVSAWNVKDIDYMALPPCHYSFQFYTRELTYAERWKWLCKHDYSWMVRSVTPTEEELDKEGVPTRGLSLMWQQRSVDSLLGLPINILSYSILLSMVAQCVNMIPDELVFSGGDCHVYENQVEIYEKEQKGRNSHKFALPKLVLNSEIKNIDDFKFEDIKIENYESYPVVKYPLSVG